MEIRWLGEVELTFNLSFYRSLVRIRPPSPASHRRTTHVTVGAHFWGGKDDRPRGAISASLRLAAIAVVVAGRISAHRADADGSISGTRIRQ
jgi:hypothetical protein